MRIAHLSDLHFRSADAAWKSVAKRSPAVALGVAGWLAHEWYSSGKGRPLSSNALRIWAGATGTAATYMMRPLFNHWHDPEGALEALLDDLARAEVDHVVITGDVSTHADATEFQRAAAYVKRLEEVVGPGAVTLLPGNHDAPLPYAPTNVMTREPVRDKLGRYLGHFADRHDATNPFPVLRRVGNVCLVGLDSVQRSMTFNNAGFVDPEQLRRAQAALRRPDIRGLVPILCLHHPPAVPATSFFSAENPLVTGGLSNASQVLGWAAEVGIRLVLCGHQHTMYHLAGAVPVYCGGATPRLIDQGAPVAYRVFSQERGALRVHERTVRLERERTAERSAVRVPARC